MTGSRIPTPLAPRTTLCVGGPARCVVQARTEDEARSALRRAGGSLVVLGGGSNLLVSDRGLPGTVLMYDDDALRVVRDEGARVQVWAGAGADWDTFVAWTVAQGLAGLECLSGIPGRVGAAPIQNIGAYGQEVADTIVWVDALERPGGAPRRFAPADCAFGYRSSRFKHAEPEGWLVTGVAFDLVRGGAPSLRYADLARRAAALGPAPTLDLVRDLVIEVRASKGMVVDPRDPDSRSAGSFFTNPIVDPATARSLDGLVAARGEGPMPSWEIDGDRKLAAAWLIERAGFGRGWGQGPAGLSGKHSLAIVNRGGATALDVIAVAAAVRAGVRAAFGVTLVPEPVFAGFLGPTIDDATAVLDAYDAGELPE